MTITTIPDDTWISRWQFGVLHDEDGGEIVGGEFFSFENIALWRCINQLSMLYNADLNTADYNLKIVDRIIEALYYGDWITQLMSIVSMEHIDCFNPEYVAYIRNLCHEDCCYNEWSSRANRSAYWTEAGFNMVRRYAKFAAWRLDHYGDIQGAVVDGDEGEESSHGTARAVDLFFNDVIPDEYNSSRGSSSSHSPKPVIHRPPTPLPLLPPPVKRAALPLPSPNGNSRNVIPAVPSTTFADLPSVKDKSITKKKTLRKPVKKVQQRLF